MNEAEAKAILEEARRQNRLGKEPKAVSLRARQAMAKFGKAARHPLCLAALDLWACDVELSKLKKNALSTKQLLNDVERQKKQSRALLDQFYKEGKEKEVIEAAALVRNINELLPKAQNAHQLQIKLLAIYGEVRRHYDAQFKRESLAADRFKDTSAFKALPRVQRRWGALSNGARLKYSELREFGILQLLRDKKIRAESAKGGVLAEIMEAKFGGNRSLSDDEWQGRLTAREIHSRLMVSDGADVAGDKDAKEVRRNARRLGIRLDEDQRGRRWKGPRPKTQRVKKPQGRPPKPDFIGNFEAAEPFLGLNQTNTAGHALSGGDIREPVKYGNTSYGGLDSWVRSAWKDLKEIDREIRSLTLRRGGNKGLYVYQGA